MFIFQIGYGLEIIFKNRPNSTQEPHALFSSICTRERIEPPAAQPRRHKMSLHCAGPQMLVSMALDFFFFEAQTRGLGKRN